MMMTIGKLKISGAALLALAAAYFFDSEGILAATVIAAAVHEAGHYAALRICGQRISELKLELWGLSMGCDARMPYRIEIITSAAGPLISLLLALAAAAAGRFLHSQQAYMLSGVSLVFCVFNALPAIPLDGGKALYAASALLLGVERAERILCILSCTVILALLAAGMLVLIITKTNFSLFLAAVWLLFSYCKRSGISIKLKRKNDGSEKWITN